MITIHIRNAKIQRTIFNVAGMHANKKTVVAIRKRFAARGSRTVTLPTSTWEAIESLLQTELYVAAQHLFRRDMLPAFKPEDLLLALGNIAQWRLVAELESIDRKVLK